MKALDDMSRNVNLFKATMVDGNVLNNRFDDTSNMTRVVSTEMLSGMDPIS